MEDKESFSFTNYIDSEFRRGYHLEYDRERFAARKEKIYAFFKIPLEVEKLVVFGFFHCIDSFLFVITFLPIRFIVALGKFMKQCFYMFFWKKNAQTQLIRNMEVIDLIKGFLIITACFVSTYVDTSMFYHLIKTQSAVKLYIFYNMLEIADKLMSALGQDMLDALFWTATATKGRKRDYILLLFHLIITLFYISLHSGIVLLQALVLNVAVNSESKGLLTIVISNNFIEIKGSVFKKYDRNNLLQIACSDVRERFQHGILIFVVIMLTMKEYSWNQDRLIEMLIICFIIFWVEMGIDWLKHAFITRFNEIPIDVYKDYMLLISSDLVMCKKQNAFSDHSDLVARRMGFTPMPLGVIVFRILSQTLKFNNLFSIFLLFIGYLCLLSFRIFNSIVILAVACWYIEDVNQNRPNSESERKDSVWRNAVDSYCERVQTPLRSRRRTISMEDKLETLIKSEGGLIPPEQFGEPIHPSGECIDRMEDNSGSESSLGFLGESRSVLLSNSMLNLVEVGMDTPTSSLDGNELEIGDDGFIATDFIEKIPLQSTLPNSNLGNTDIAVVSAETSHLLDVTESRRPAEVNESLDNPDISESEILPILRKGVLVAGDTEENTQINSSNKHY